MGINKTQTRNSLTVELIAMSNLKKDKEQNQLALFGFFASDSNRVSRFEPQLVHSNTISIYDALPKYQWSTRAPKNLHIKRSCVLDGVQYDITIVPASIERVNPKTKKRERVEVYPGEREEAIEDVLRGLAANGQGEVFEHELGVHFTIRQVMSELKNLGRTFSYAEVVEAILVCNRTSLSITINGKAVNNSALFTTFSLVSRENYENDTSAKCFVRFHPMVTASVINLDYRMLNYRLAMAIRNPLARHIYKRMSHYWRQASKAHTYNFNLMTYLSQTPRNISPRMSRNLEAMNKALDELIKHDVLDNYAVQEVIEGRSLKDAGYICTPHESFIADIKKSNYVASRRSLYSVLPELPKELR